MSQITLSCIVPVYKVELNYLEECFESIDRQTFRDFELIIVDDGAPQEIADYLDTYVASKSYAKVYHKENKGVAVARNFGLSQCNGEYVTFVDSDDTIRKDNFEKIISRAKKDNLDVLMWGMKLCFPDKQVEFSPYLEDIDLFDEDRLLEVQYKCLVGTLPSFKKPASADAAGSACAKLYRVDFLKGNNLLYTEGLKRAEDMFFNLTVLGKAKRVGYLYDFFYNYRQLATSATYQYRPGGIEVFTDTLQAMGKYLNSINASYDFMQIYYMRCMFFLLESMDMDVLNPMNKDSYWKRRESLKMVAVSMPYKEAIGKLQLMNKQLVITRKIPLVLLRLHMYGFLMLFYKVYGLLKG